MVQEMLACVIFRERVIVRVCVSLRGGIDEIAAAGKMSQNYVTKIKCVCLCKRERELT